MMRQDDDAPELNRSQRSVRYYSDVHGQRDPLLRSRPDYFGMFYPHMLIEDVGLGVMPIGGRMEQSRFKISLSTANQDAERVIGEALTYDEYGYGDNLSAAVCDFFQTCANSVLAFGPAPHEIVYLSEAAGGKVVGFELVPIQPATVFRRFGKLVQYLPADVAETHHLPRHIELLADDILWFEPPEDLAERIPEMMDQLAALSQRPMPDFAMREMTQNAGRTVYNFSDHHLWQRKAVASACKEIGWNARDYTAEGVLPYYLLHRRLRFEKFKIDLRHSLLSTLNAGIARVGKKIGFEGELVVEGLPSLSDVTAAETDLREGKKSSKEILAPFQRY